MEENLKIIIDNFCQDGSCKKEGGTVGTHVHISFPSPERNIVRTQCPAKENSRQPVRNELQRNP